MGAPYATIRSTADSASATAARASSDCWKAKPDPRIDGELRRRTAGGERAVIPHTPTREALDGGRSRDEAVEADEADDAVDIALGEARGCNGVIAQPPLAPARDDRSAAARDDRGGDAASGDRCRRGETDSEPRGGLAGELPTRRAGDGKGWKSPVKGGVDGGECTGGWLAEEGDTDCGGPGEGEE